MGNRVSFKIGEIEFEAEGTAEVIESERSVFVNTILPAAVDAIVRTKGVTPAANYIENQEPPKSLPYQEGEILEDIESEVSLERTSLASFLKPYGELTEQDFTLISAFYDEKKNGVKSFTSENVKKYYSEARRTEPKNISMSLNQLARKGFIMDAPESSGKTPKLYTISSDGLQYIESYTPKEGNSEKKTVSKPRKSRAKVESIYKGINIDDLNLKNYPSVNEMGDFKSQMLLILYIVTNEKAGDAFSAIDILYLMIDVFGIHATEDKIKGVFRRNKTWFKKENDVNNPKIVRRKLLHGAIEFAERLVENKANE